MNKIIVKTTEAPLPIGPYNQAAKYNNLVYTSGQIPIDPKTNQVAAVTIEDQTRLVLTHLKTVLTAAGSSLEKILKTTVFLKNMNDFPKMNSVYTEFFAPENAPARSTIEVARLPKDVLVEIEAVAFI